MDRLMQSKTPFFNKKTASDKRQFFYLKLYKKRVFKACEARKTAVYYGVNEDFEGKYNAENTFFDNFINLRHFGRANYSTTHTP